VLRITAATAVGAALGGALVAGGLYREARATVESRLSGAVWETTGQVLSGPFEIWPGLALTPEELAGDLQKAGYTRQDRPSRPGEFSVSGQSVLVLTRAERGPDWSIADSEALVTFREGTVASISPGASLTLPPARLSSVRGPGNVARTPRPLSQFPRHLQDAVLAMEDDGFWEHRGVSAPGMLRAVLVNAWEGARVQGGSTLTQQLAKNLFLSPERTYARKAREALLAFALEQRLSKEELLALYLNGIYWGQAGGASICGADEASRAYFGKPASQLSLGEAATLGGVISAPNAYNPLRHPEAARERRDLALRRMAEEGFITPEAARAAAAEPLAVDPPPAGRAAPYAVDAALEQVDEMLGEGAVLREGLSVQTTIHPALQRLAERAVAAGLAEVEAARPGAAGAQAALVAMRASDGAVLAMVGGRDYGASQFNRVTLGRRQIGSTVKPLTLLAALEADPELSPADRFEDEPLTRTVDGVRWSPENYDGKYVEALPLRDAIAQSRNIPAVHLAEEVGLTHLQGFNKKLGLSGATAHLSASLGAFEASPLELVGAYSVFPGRGRRVSPRLLAAVSRPGGEVLDRRVDESRRVASERATWMAADVLRSVVSEGTGRKLSSYGLPASVAGKTGTTDGYRDAWFAGYAPTRDGDALVVVVWVGFDRAKSTGLTGASGALPIWGRFMAGAGPSGALPPRPESVVTAEACVGGYEGGRCSECAEELFSAGHAPSKGCARKRLTARDRGREDDGDEAPGDIWDHIEAALDDEPRDRRKKRRKSR
jgi:penicillin-binding protein 1B